MSRSPRRSPARTCRVRAVPGESRNWRFIGDLSAMPRVSPHLTEAVRNTVGHQASLPPPPGWKPSWKSSTNLLEPSLRSRARPLLRSMLRRSARHTAVYQTRSRFEAPSTPEDQGDGGCGSHRSRGRQRPSDPHRSVRSPSRRDYRAGDRASKRRSPAVLSSLISRVWTTWEQVPSNSPGSSIA
jgi:hypothetical protein